MDGRILSSRILLLVSLVLWNSCSSAQEASDSNTFETFWNLIGIIKTIRHGPDQVDPTTDILKDPHFIYSTLYREEDDDGGERSASSMAAGFHGNLLRVLDILEMEHRLRRLRRQAKAEQRPVIEETINESAIATPSPPTSETMGGAVGSHGCNMADPNPSDTTDQSYNSAACSIQRSKRQVEELEPYVPYLGFVFYSFPIFSFTLPFGGQLKLFGYDFI